MTTYTLPNKDWTTALAAIIKAAEIGDTIVVSNVAAKELAERALRRMCPEKSLTFVVQDAHDAA
jgi:hypothetical protein